MKIKLPRKGLERIIAAQCKCYMMNKTVSKHSASLPKISKPSPNMPKKPVVNIPEDNEFVLGTSFPGYIPGVSSDYTTFVTKYPEAAPLSSKVAPIENNEFSFPKLISGFNRKLNDLLKRVF